jgi:hypothetical protein
MGLDAALLAQLGQQIQSISIYLLVWQVVCYLQFNFSTPML